MMFNGSTHTLLVALLLMVVDVQLKMRDDGKRCSVEISMMKVIYGVLVR